MGERAVDADGVRDDGAAGGVLRVQVRPSAEAARSIGPPCPLPSVAATPAKLTCPAASTTKRLRFDEPALAPYAYGPMVAIQHSAACPVVTALEIGVRLRSVPTV